MPEIQWTQSPGAQTIYENMGQSGNVSFAWIQTGGSLSRDEEHAKCLYMYLDESGNLDFNNTGTPYFMMTCVLCRRPFTAGIDLMGLKYDRMESDMDTPGFHASEDTSRTRREVYSVIAKHVNEFDVYVLRVLKNELHQDMKDAMKLYAEVFDWIVSKASQEIDPSNCSKLIVVTDDIPKAARKKQLVKPLKECMARITRDLGISYKLMHHPSSSDFNLQVADYLCWAAKRLHQDGKDWPYNKVKSAFVEYGEIKNQEAENKTEGPKALRDPGNLS